jgi:O-antigen ligase
MSLEEVLLGMLSLGFLLGVVTRQFKQNIARESAPTPTTYYYYYYVLLYLLKIMSPRSPTENDVSISSTLTRSYKEVLLGLEPPKK